ncbi:hypothetical protein [Bacteroides sp.]|uniref:hypothetical protein n=1 Tax=Bacteroides sp. TaxID=29523 RepID=UPI002614D20D|nr:hypothetical protein [Bacteroides sp.]MDD3040201.1 hypothetical protein [Bacteroides sp.]
MKIIEESDQYYIFQWEYDNMPITFKRWKQTDIKEIRVNEYFAKANGYTSVKDMVNQTVGQAKMNELFGGVPDWIRASPNGDFTFVGVNRAMLN